MTFDPGDRDDRPTYSDPMGGAPGAPAGFACMDPECGEFVVDEEANARKNATPRQLEQMSERNDH
jgi:hypothetical protein